MEIFIGMIFMVLILCGYFLPALVASYRGAKNTMGIALLNLLLGFTGIFWVAALVWAVCAEKEEEPEPVKRGKSTGWGDD